MTEEKKKPDVGLEVESVRNKHCGCPVGRVGLNESEGEAEIIHELTHSTNPDSLQSLGESSVARSLPTANYELRYLPGPWMSFPMLYSLCYCM